MTQYLSMFFAVIAIAATAACGTFGLRHVLAGARASLPLPLIIGAGFSLCLALVAIALPPVNVIVPSFQLSSWLVLCALAIAAVLLTILHRQRISQAKEHVAKIIWPVTGTERFWTASLGLIIAGHYCLALVSHSIHDVFPWDAFTTWMYKSKAWVLDDHLTPVIGTIEWLSSQVTNSVPLHASGYPDFVSVVAAWVSSLTGTWQPSAASLPWAAAGLAALLATWGLLLAAGMTTTLAFVGTFMLASLPLLDMHIALAGYADIWMTLYSGIGLASLVVWAATSRESPSRKPITEPILWLGCALLLAGTQVKLEGSLWLIIGVVFIAIKLMEKRTLAWFCLISALLIASYISLSGSTAINLGPLGQWGVSSEKIYAGPLGDYNVRLYNPLNTYFETLFLQKSFAALIPLYCLAIIYLGCKRIKQITAPHLIMGGLIVVSQGVIFGVSGYSKFAEIQTATSRLIIHFLPVAILTVMTAAHHALTAIRQNRSSINTAQSTDVVANELLGRPRYLISAGLCLAAMTVIGVALLLSPNFVPTFSTAIKHEPNQLQRIVGRGNLLPNGMWRFSESNQSVGVLRSLEAPPEDTRFVSIQVAGNASSEAIFYWFDRRSPDSMNRRSMSHEGLNLFDLNSSPDWSPKDVVEWGVVVPSRHFSSIAIGEIGFSNTLGWSEFAGIIQPWVNPLEVSQRTINGTQEPTENILPWQHIASLSVIILALIGLASRSRYRATCYLALVFVWISTDLLWIHSHARHLQTRIGNTISDGQLRSEGFHLKKTVAGIKSELDQRSATLIIAAGDGYDYEIQRLAFLMLPQRISFLRSDTRRLPGDWQGTVIIYGQNPQELEAVGRDVVRRLRGSSRQLTEGDDFYIVHPS